MRNKRSKWLWVLIPILIIDMLWLIWAVYGIFTVSFYPDTLAEILVFPAVLAIQWALFFWQIIITTIIAIILVILIIIVSRKRKRRRKRKWR